MSVKQQHIVHLTSTEGPKSGYMVLIMQMVTGVDGINTILVMLEKRLDEP